MDDTVIQTGRSSVWSSIKEAIHGSHQDFTQGPISRAIFLLAVPMVLEMSMESLFAIVDVFWVTRLGSNAVATVGLTESIVTLVFAIAFGISMSTTAMVARRIGEKNERGAATAAAQAILLGVVLAFAIGIPAALSARRLLGWMGGSPELIAGGHRYTRVVFGGTVSVMLLFLNNGIFRGAGDAAIAMRVLWVSNLINLVLDPCFIFGLGPFPALGVTGAAVSTLTGRTVGVLYQLWILKTGRSRILIRWSDFKIVPPVIGSLIRVSSTGVLQFAVTNTSWIVLVRIISGFGSAAVAGYTIGIRIFIFAVLPSWGMSGAAATLMGQSLGAKKPERAARAVYLTGFYNTIVLGIVAIAFIGFPELLVRMFTSDPIVGAFAVDCLRVIGYGNIIYGFGMVMVQAFNGAGDTVTPTVINVIAFWLFQVPVAWALAFPAQMGVKGVFASIPLSQLLATLIGVVIFLRGGWKRQKI